MNYYRLLIYSDTSWHKWAIKNDCNHSAPFLRLRDDSFSGLFRGNRHHDAVERYLLDGTEPKFDLLNTPYWS